MLTNFAQRAITYPTEYNLVQLIHVLFGQIKVVIKARTDNEVSKKERPLAFYAIEHSQLPRLVMQTVRVFSGCFVAVSKEPDASITNYGGVIGMESHENQRQQTFQGVLIILCFVFSR